MSLFLHLGSLAGVLAALFNPALKFPYGPPGVRGGTRGVRLEQDITNPAAGKMPLVAFWAKKSRRIFQVNVSHRLTNRQCTYVTKKVYDF